MAEALYVSRVDEQWAANHANLLLATFGVNSSEYTGYMAEHPELTTVLQVNPDFNFSSPQVKTLVYLYAAGLFDYIGCASPSTEYPDFGLQIVWKAGSEDAVRAILNGSGFDHGGLGGMHKAETGPGIDYRSWAFGPASLQITWGSWGVYVDNDLFNPYNPVGFVLHGVFELIPSKLHLPQPRP